MKYLRVSAFIFIFLSLSLSACVSTSASAPPQQIIAATPATLAAATVDPDKLRIALETAHFMIYCKPCDEGCVQGYADALESQFDYITAELRVTLKDKAIVEVYHDQSDLFDAYGEHATGMVKRHKMLIISPETAQESLELMHIIIVHEFTHYALEQRNTMLYTKSWLSEGIAVYEAGGPPQPVSADIIVAVAAKNGSIPTLRELLVPKLNGELVYACAGKMVEYLVETYGRDAMLKLVDTPSDFKNILGLSEKEFYDNWIVYLEDKYKKQS